MLRATTACNFSSLIWPAGSAPAALASLLFDPPDPQIIGKTWKTQCFATLHPDLLSSHSFFFLLFSGSSHLCFSSVHIVGSLTSKLPSMKCTEYSVKRRVWSVKRRVSSVSMKCKMYSVKCIVQSVEYKV